LAERYEWLPAEGKVLDWAELFGRQGARRIEIGTGNGLFLAEEAAREPGVDFLGIEREPEFYWKMVKRMDRAGLTNVRTTRLDAWDALELVPAGSVERVYCYFSDPWPKRRHAKNRVVQAELLPELERVLAPGGEFWFKSDVGWYFNLAVTVFRERAELGGGAWEFVERCRLEPPEVSGTGVMTNFERKGREAGREPWGFKARWKG
jgi:tRNA (guanine-N7-)-methyltransferase